MQRHAAGETVAITATTNEHVDEINHTIRQLKARHGDTDTTTIASIADGSVAVGDIVATRRNQRQLRTTSGDIVQNRELWTVTAINDDGDLTVTDLSASSTVTLAGRVRGGACASRVRGHRVRDPPLFLHL